MFEYLGLLLVLLSWLGGVYIIRKWRGTNVMSISQHAASAAMATTFFKVILVVFGSALYAWLILWFAPNLDLPDIFTILATITFMLQIVVAIIPDTEAKNRLVHRTAAYIMAVLYFPLSYIILVSEFVSDKAQIIGWICLGYMTFATLLFFIVKQARSNYLIFQSLYIVAFQIIILSSAYI